MNKVTTTIGLIGGVGPWAGLNVHQKILEEAIFLKEQECISIIHHSIPHKFSDRSEFLLGKTSINPAFAFIKELKRMQNLGVDVAAIVCNTAHAEPILRLIQAESSLSSLRYVNIIEETLEVVQNAGHKKIGLLATLGTYNFNLYRNRFDGDMIYPNSIDQQRVHDCVYHPDYGMKVHFPKYLNFVYSELIDVANKLIFNGAEALVLGCTELPLLADFKDHFDVPIYDPNRILARALIDHSALNTTLQLKRETINN